MPNPMRIIPAMISKNFVENLRIFSPIKNPKFELINVIKAINNAGFMMRFPYNDSDIPAENASMLVAMPISNRHVKSIQRGFCLLGLHASVINFSPR